ncbi:hypothetical protein BH18ACT13_BH18ACT13_11240 [soil metagenome]
MVQLALAGGYVRWGLRSKGAVKRFELPDKGLDVARNLERARIELLTDRSSNADLLDNPVPLLPPDDALDSGEHMLGIRGDEKVSGSSANSFVLLVRQPHRFRAVLVSAFACPLRQRRAYPFVVSFYSFVVVPKEAFLFRCANCINGLVRHALRHLHVLRLRPLFGAMKIDLLSA